MHEIVERGLESFRQGQLIILSFPSYLDSDIVNDKKYPSKTVRKRLIDKQMDNGPRLPGIILKKHTPSETNTFDIPVYDVGFWSRHRSGENSGMIILKEIPVWRFLRGDVVEEGTPPRWLIEMYSNPDDDLGEFAHKDIDYKILLNEICFIKPGDDKDGSNDYWYYPFTSDHNKPDFIEIRTMNKIDESLNHNKTMIFNEQSITFISQQAKRKILVSDMVK